MKSRNLVIKFITHTKKAIKDVKAFNKELFKTGQAGKKTSRTLGEVYDKALGKTTKKTKKLTDATKKLTIGSFNSKKALQGLTAAMGRSGFRARGLLTVFQSIPSSLKAIAGAAVLVGVAFNRMIKHGIKAEGAMETISILADSHTKALHLYGKALRYAGETPFNPGEMGAATGRAFQFGLTNPFEKAIQGAKKKWSAMDIFAALGSFTDMEGQMIGIGRSMQSLMTGSKRMARPFYGVINEAWEKTKKITRAAGQVQGGEVWKKTILEEIGKMPRVMELTRRLSLDVQGAWSTIAGYSTEIWLAMSGIATAAPDTFWKQLNVLLVSAKDSLRVWLDDSSLFLEQLGAIIMGIFTVIHKAGSAIWAVFGVPIRKIWLALMYIGSVVLKTIIGAFKVIWAIVKGIGEVIGHSIALMQGVSSWGVIIKKNNDEMADMVQYTKDTITYINIMIFFLTQSIGYLKDALIDLIDRAVTTFTEKFHRAILVIGIRLRKMMLMVTPIIAPSQTKGLMEGLVLAEQKLSMVQSGHSIKNVNKAYDIIQRRRFAALPVKDRKPGVVDNSPMTAEETAFAKNLTVRWDRQEQKTNIFGAKPGETPSKESWNTVNEYKNMLIRKDEEARKEAKSNAQAIVDAINSKTATPEQTGTFYDMIGEGILDSSGKIK